MSDTVHIAKLSLVEGQRRQAPPEIGQVKAHGGTLYVMVEVSAPADTWDEASRDIVSQVLRTFASSKMGETSAMQAAAEAANTFLLEQNKALSREEQVWAGFNAAFLRDDHLYLAQAGPALTYIARGNSVTRFPKSFSELREQRMEALAPLGEQPVIKSRLAHFVLQPDDRVTMAASHLPTLGSEEAIENAVRQGVPTEIGEALSRIARGNDFSALVLHYEPSRVAVERSSYAPLIEEEEPDEELAEWEDVYEEDEALEEEELIWAARDAGTEEAEIPTRPSTPRTTLTPDAERQQAASRGEKTTRPAVQQRTREGSSVVLRPVPRRKASPSPATLKRSAARSTKETISGAVGAFRAAGDRSMSTDVQAMVAPLVTNTRAYASRAVDTTLSLPWEQWGRQIAAAFVAIGVAVLALLSALAGWWSNAVVPQFSKAAPALDRLAYSLRRWLSYIGYVLERVLRQLLPGDHPAPPPRVETAPPLPGDGSSFLRLTAILLPLLVVLAVVVMGRGDNTATVDVVTPEGDAAALIGEARDLIFQAENVDEATAQVLILQANEKLKAAEPLVEAESATAEIAQLRAQAEQLIDRAGNITRGSSTRLASLPAGSQPRSLVMGKDALFALEGARASVYRVFTNSEAPVNLPEIAPLLSAQQRLGEGVLANTPEFIAWVPAGGGRTHDGLLILAEGQLFDFDVSANVIRPLSFSAVLTDLQDVEGYDGNLYLLDKTNKQIWKYTPDGAGEYSAPPQPWVSPNAQSLISNPVDIAVDGFIYILDASGEVTRFQGGEQKSFALDPVTPPLTEPVAIAKLPPEETDLFVADSQRVVRFTQEGKFLAEYHAPLENDWGTIRDITVDPTGEKLYVLSDTGIFTVNVDADEGETESVEEPVLNGEQE